MDLPPLRAPGPSRVAWSVDEAAAALGLHPKTVRDLIAQGELPASRIGRRVLVRASDLDAMLVRRRIGGTG